ncbi:1-aminocyclopropane-1-carboxylate deaminase/D-cysteine desulfhydrase [Flavobacterium sp. UMI-01]|uniref:1-aminocyclopropane-1-carboxylate deaminase/D-cysteine desulfhydrase n=1 Tax=Flavobacterium sp. UMI-01 TaxID=1441053 RepID=UPI001C7DBD90|nr:pyridoxal-phosphate dependent enzyme [Flavobacterium sp. UMI-01]
MNQQILIDFPNHISVYIKREDLIHPFISGNKFRKLKYNLLEAKKENATTLVTFGGAYSNHIAAVAFAGKEQHFKTIGVIRGEELATKIQENPTLKFAQECGMQFEFITREAYRSKDDEKLMTDLRTKWGAFYLIPEGGTNALAISGCEEILTPEDANFDYVCCAVGTGGTISGIINSVLPHQKVLGFPALKGDFLQDEISTFVQNSHWSLIQDYHFGGYGKVTTELIAFINHFYQKNAIPLDPIYTGKMMYGILDLIEKNYFPENSTILVIHTGGLQGVAGMNIKLKNKNLPLIQIHD